LKYARSNWFSVALRVVIRADRARFDDLALRLRGLQADSRGDVEWLFFRDNASLILRSR
jgi:hypothetical protein